MNIPVKVMGDVMNGHQTATIKCLYTDQVVRKLKVEGDNLVIDAMTETVTVPLDTPLIYEPWFMDRGSILFNLDGRPAKFCGEADKICFDNEDEWHSIEPHSDLTGEK
jgi:hypothetical protein